MKCPNCKKEIPDDALVCGYCGTKLVKQQTCPNCGKQVPSDAVGCGYCGTKLGEQPVPAQAAPAPKIKKPARVKTVKQAEPKKQGLSAAPPRWLLPAALAAFAVLAALGLFLLLRTTPAGDSAAQAPASKPPVSKEGKAPLDSTDQTSIDDIAGTWRGVATNDSGGDDVELILHFDEGCVLGEICGYSQIVEFPDNRLDIAIVGFKGDKLNSESYNDSGDVDNESTEEQWLRLVSSEELEFYSRGDYGVYQGIFYRGEEPEEEVVVVFLTRASGEPYFASPDDIIDLYTGWGADTDEYIEDYLDAVRFEATLDGKQIFLEEIDIGCDYFDGKPCAYHYNSIGRLEEGSHTATLHTYFTRLIEDGGEETYGPGGDIEDWYHEQEIIIE